MKIRRKGAAIAFSATLLAAMIAVIAAPLASAAVTVTSAGTVPRGGTSTGTASFSFAESTVNCLALAGVPLAGPEIQVGIADSASGATVTFSGTPVVTAPGSLGASASVTGNVLSINLGGTDPLNIEQVTVSGLKIAAAAGAATGAIQASLIAFGAATPPAVLACIQAGGTASGTVVSGIGIGSTAVILNVSTLGCLFTTTPPGGNLVFATAADPIAVSVASLIDVPAAGQQTLTLATPTTAVHNAGEVVTQATACPPTGVVASPGTVASALTQSATNTQVFPGENNQFAGTVTVSDLSAGPGTGTLFTGQTLTFSISATGVKFSAPFTVSPSFGVNLGAGPGTSVLCSLNVARTSCSVTVTADAAGDDSVFLSSILLDVDSTAVLGSPVHLTVGTSPAVAVNVASDTIAFVGRVVIGVGATPTIFMGFNDQATGTITLNESAAGFFVAGLSGNNTFALCLESNELFTRAPWAVVTVPGGVGPAGLQLLSGVVGAPQAKGTLFTDSDGESCALWTIFSPSTTGPATIEIRGSADDTTPLGPGANNGPRLSVPNNLQPGSTQSEILIGNANACPDANSVRCDGGAISIATNAIRAFKNSVTVTAASQPNCAPGATDCLLGNVVITETQNGQLKAGQNIFGWILPRSTTLRNDVKIKATNTNDLPIITTNVASGLLVSPVTVICPPVIPLLQICVFTATVTQQSFGPTLGQITVSNMHATVTPDAVRGPIQTEWSNSLSSLGITFPSPVTGQEFDSIVTNGNVGTGAATTKTSASSAVTKTTNPTAFSVGTKVVTLVSSSNNIVTIRIKVDPSLVGQSVRIQVAHKSSSGTWSSFTNLTTRVIGSDGYAYYYASAHSAQWNSYRGMFPGTPTFGSSTSQTVQVRWR